MDNKQKEQLKKGLVFGRPGPLFTFSMRFTSAPSGKDKSTAQQGLNDSIPRATTEQLTGSKPRAYELGDKSRQDEQTREETGRLSDHFDSNTIPSEGERAEVAAPTAKIESLMHYYEENNRLLNFPYAPDPNEQEREALRSELDNLKKELASKNGNEDAEEKRQLALMEKSYQMTAKCLLQSSLTTATTNAFTPAKGGGTLETSATKQVSSTGPLPAMEILAERKQVVSSLNQPMADTDFVQQCGTKPRNMGFHSLASTVAAVPRNTPSVVVDRMVTLKEGDNVALHLLEIVQAQGLRIPRQSRFIAGVKIESNRLYLLVKSTGVEGRITVVKLSVYDTDGQEEVLIPGSEDINALEEVGANISGLIGTSFTFVPSAKDQIISEAACEVMQGVSQLFQKKLRTVKVTLKGGYRLSLVQSR